MATKSENTPLFALTKSEYADLKEKGMKFDSFKSHFQNFANSKFSNMFVFYAK